MEIKCDTESETTEWIHKRQMESRGFEEDLTDFILAAHQRKPEWCPLEIIPMLKSVASTIWKSQETKVGMVTSILKHITTHPEQGKSPYMQVLLRMTLQILADLSTNWKPYFEVSSSTNYLRVPINWWRKHLQEPTIVYQGNKAW